MSHDIIEQVGTARGALGRSRCTPPRSDPLPFSYHKSKVSGTLTFVVDGIHDLGGALYLFIMWFLQHRDGTIRYDCRGPRRGAGGVYVLGRVRS